MMSAAVAWVFSRVLGVRVWLVRGCWRGCQGGRMRAGFGGLVCNLQIAVLRAVEEIVEQHRVDDRVVLLLFVVVRAAGALAQARVVCLRGSAWVSGTVGSVGGSPAGRCAIVILVRGRC